MKDAICITCSSTITQTLPDAIILHCLSYLTYSEKCCYQRALSHSLLSSLSHCYRHDTLTLELYREDKWSNTDTESDCVSHRADVWSEAEWHGRLRHVPHIQSLTMQFGPRYNSWSHRTVSYCSNSDNLLRLLKPIIDGVCHGQSLTSLSLIACNQWTETDNCPDVIGGLLQALNSIGRNQCSLQSLSLHGDYYQYNTNWMSLSSWQWQGLLNAQMLQSLHIDLRYGNNSYDNTRDNDKTSKMMSASLPVLMSSLPSSITDFRIQSLFEYQWNNDSESVDWSHRWNEAFSDPHFLPLLARLEVRDVKVPVSLTSTVMVNTNTVRPINTLSVSLYDDPLCLSLTSPFSSLRCLEIDQIPEPHQFASPLVEAFPVLTIVHLRLDEYQVAAYVEPFFNFLSQHGGIEKLTITMRDSTCGHFLEPFSDAAMRMLGTLTKLRHLTIDTGRLNESLFQNCVIDSTLLTSQCWPHLTTLSLNGAIMKNAELSVLLSATPSLTDLSLLYCCDFTGLLILALIHGKCPLLERLRIVVRDDYEWPNVFNDRIKVRDDFLSNLRHLRIDGLMPDHTLHTIVNSLRSATKLAFLDIHSKNGSDSDNQRGSAMINVCMQRVLPSLRSLSEHDITAVHDLYFAKSENDSDQYLYIEPVTTVMNIRQHDWADLPVDHVSDSAILYDIQHRHDDYECRGSRRWLYQFRRAVNHESGLDGRAAFFERLFECLSDESKAGVLATSLIVTCDT